MSWLRLHVHSFPSVGVILVLIQPGCLLWAEGVLRLHTNLPSYRILAVEGQSIKNRGYGGASEELRRAQRLHKLCLVILQGTSGKQVLSPHRPFDVTQKSLSGAVSSEGSAGWGTQDYCLLAWPAHWGASFQWMPPSTWCRITMSS